MVRIVKSQYTTSQYKGAGNMKAVDTLLDASRDKMVGNHRVQTRGIGDVYRSFFHFGTEICRVWDDSKEFWIIERGTVSTNQACNAYRRELTNRGYTERDK